MQPIGKQPGRKPVRRRARILQKEKEISDRATKIIDRFLRKVGELDAVFASSILSESLQEFLEKKGMGRRWRLGLMSQCIRRTEQELLDTNGHPRTEAISRKDEALILKKIRAFWAAIEEAKNAGIT